MINVQSIGILVKELFDFGLISNIYPDEQYQVLQYLP